MPTPRPVKRSFLGQCARDLCDIVGWGALWLALGALASVQAWLLLAGELRLPDFVRERLQTQLAAHGLRADYDRALIDPSGTLVIERLRLNEVRGGADPLLTARTVLVRLDPWALLTGRVQVDGIEGDGLAVNLPAFASPSGRAEAVLDDAQFRLRMNPGGLVTLDAVSGRIAGVPVALDGELTLPVPPPRAGGGRPDLSSLYPAARRLVTIGEQVRPLGEPTVRGRVSPGRVEVVARAPRIDLARLPPTALPAMKGEAEEVTVTVTVPLGFRARPVAAAEVGRLQVELTDGGALPAFTAEGVRARLTGATLTDWDDWPAFTLEAGARTLAAFPFSLSATGLRANLLPDGRLAAGLVTSVDGQPWRLDYAGDPADGAAVVSLDARPTAGLMRSVEPLVPSKIPLTRLLTLGPAPRLRATARLGAGGVPLGVEGSLAGGDAVAYGVRIREAAADFRWAGDELAFSDILLRINESEARGDYTMNLGTNDFRFLLAGRLDPPDIGGWFHGWWGRFWSDFVFGEPAVADVEVAGRWGEPHGTRVFVAAEGRGTTTLHGQPLETLRARLFIRPGWYDALHVLAREPGGGTAEGRFGLAMPPEATEWERLDFDFDSTLPAGALIRLLGPDAEPVFAPYVFTKPPRIRVAGEARAGNRRDVRFTASTGSPFTFADFGVESLRVEGRMVDEVLTLDPMEARLAGGELRGRAVVSGPADDRWLALDHRLAGADLDTVLDLLAAREAASAGDAGRAAGDGKADEGRPRRPGGKLDLTLQANGPLDHPEDLQGAGRATITDGHFAEINLLGPLSEVLRSTGLGFTSFSLDNLKTRYELDRGVLTFPDLKLGGKSAVLEANGRYVLDGGRLDFRAKLFPYESRGGVLGSAADLVLAPLSNALEFRLGGTLEKPAWSFTYGPRGWLRGLTGERAPITPEAPVGEGGER